MESQLREEGGAGRRRSSAAAAAKADGRADDPLRAAEARASDARFVFLAALSPKSTIESREREQEETENVDVRVCTALSNGAMAQDT